MKIRIPNTIPNIFILSYLLSYSTLFELIESQLAHIRSRHGRHHASPQIGAKYRHPLRIFFIE